MITRITRHRVALLALAAVLGIALLAVRLAAASRTVARSTVERANVHPSEMAQPFDSQSSPEAVSASPAQASAPANHPPARPADQATSSRTITFSYDSAGRLVQANYGSGKTIAYTYDKAGNLLSSAVTTVARLYLPLMMR